MKADGLDPLRLAALSVSPAHDPPRVLVAEDDYHMLRLVVEDLREDGYDVTGVRDGGSLVGALGGGLVGRGEMTTDLIVTDVQMPVCSGLQVLRELRRAHCSVPVILVTAFGDGFCVTTPTRWGRSCLASRSTSGTCGRRSRSCYVAACDEVDGRLGDPC